MDINVEKAICLVIFFLVTLVPGATIVLLFSRCQKRLTSRAGKMVLALLKCFAGGVFLSTCLLSLLDEGLEEYQDFKETAQFKVDYPFFHLGIGVGFFLVAYMERVAFCISSHHHVDVQERRKDDPAVSDAEGVKMETFGNKGETNKQQETAAIGEAEVNRESSESIQKDVVSFKEMAAAQNDHQAAAAGEVNDTHHQHHAAVQKRHSTRSDVSVEEEERTSGIRAIIFLLALSFHTLFDGLAVGLQDTESDVWAMTVAIAIHKVIMVTSLALELSMSLAGRPVKTLLLLFLFALMTPVGVGIGMSVTSGHVNLRAQLLAGGILQAVAAGSVLYVTFFEILSEELGHHSSVSKVSVTLVGFAAIAVAKIWDTD